jgi:transcriptional regulator with XRE-family HTH domain
MITGEQIRGARAMLDWKQSELAIKTGLSLPSINAIERMNSSPRLSTLILIQNVLQGAGIEFIGTTGVELHSEIFAMKEFKGPDFMKKLNDDLFFCMRHYEDEVLMFGVDDRMWEKHVPDQTLRHYEYQKQTGFKERMLFRYGDDFLLSNTEACRWTLPETIGVVPYYVYKDRVAMIMWDKKRVILIRSQDIADSYRAQYEFLWAQSKPIPGDSFNRLEDPAYRAKLAAKALKK